MIYVTVHDDEDHVEVWTAVLPAVPSVGDCVLSSDAKDTYVVRRVLWLSPDGTTHYPGGAIGTVAIGVRKLLRA